MQTRLTLRSQAGYTQDVEVRGPFGTTLDDIDGLLGKLVPNDDSTGSQADVGSAPAALWSGSRVLPARALVGGPGLRHGSVVGVGRPGPRDVIGAAILRLHVVCGPDAGLVTPLPRGIVIVGRGPDCDVRVTDVDCSRQHLELTVTAAGISVRDLGSSNGSRLLSNDGSPAVAVDSDGMALPLNDYVSIGDSIICVTSLDAPAAATTLSPEGHLLLNRPPRLGAVLPDRRLTVPDPPSGGRLDGLPWLATLLPALGGGVLAWWMHNIQFLAFVILSPVLMLATGLGERVSGRRSNRRQARTFGCRQAEALEQIAAVAAAETQFRRRAHPDPAAVLHLASTPTGRVWERRRDDPDFLDVRIGLADQPAWLDVLQGGATQPPPMLQSVPVWANLRAGPLGICGPRGLALGVTRWALTQLAALHSPADVALVVLVDEAEAEAWSWSRWLPHLSDGHPKASIARTREQRHTIVTQLLSRVDSATGVSRPWTGQWTVLLVDPACALVDSHAIGRVLAAGAAVGITGICIDDVERRLPPACATVLGLAGETGSKVTMRVSSAARVPGPREPSDRGGAFMDAGEVEVLADHVRPLFADQIARALAPLVDPEAASAAALPPAVRLRDLFELDDLSPSTLVARWGGSNGRAHTPLGRTAEGIFDLDLSRDGPHALIAGTTGAGKSELLQSLVAGLAVYASPQDLQFVLIDYKGGAAFADCSRLPHTAGLVTDLDGHLTERALRSLEADLKRREALFAQAGSVDLPAYRRSALHRREPVGRLVLVVDEFAALVEELPTFVTGLVAIAQRGRSLGVHLVLATQRPAGAVSAEIRANVGIRVALRVADAAESIDVLGADDAASIDRSTPGRAVMATGTSLTSIQFGRIAAPVAQDQADLDVVAVDRWGEAAAPRSVLAADATTDLQVLVEALNRAAVIAGRPTPRRPWLEPLPDVIDLGAQTGDVAGQTPRSVVIGMRDVPTEQARQPVTVDLTRGTTMLFAGGARSGRTTALRTLAGQAARSLGVDRLHIYAIDCAGSGLQVLGALPHCGAVVSRDEPARIARLLVLLSGEVDRRSRLLADHQAGSLTEDGSHTSGLPTLVLLLDGWEGFLAAVEDLDSGQAVETLLSLLREGPSMGLLAVVTGDRAALTTRLCSVMHRRFVLRLADRADYALASIAPGAVPTYMPPGRAIDVVDGSEVQLGVLGTDPSPSAQIGQLLGLAEKAVALDADRPGSCRPITLRPLPVSVTVADLGAPAQQGSVKMGCAGDAATPITIALLGSARSADARFLIAGPPRSGRSTALETIAAQVANWVGVDLIVGAGTRSGLRRHRPAGDGGRSVITPDESGVGTAITLFEPLLDEGRPTVLLLDDCEQFLDTAVGDWLTDIIRAGPANLAVVVTGRSEDLAMSFRGIGAELKKARTGVLLQPGPGDGDIFGVHLPMRRHQLPAGRGLLIGEDAPVPIQLARL